MLKIIFYLLLFWIVCEIRLVKIDDIFRRNIANFLFQVREILFYGSSGEIGSSSYEKSLYHSILLNINIISIAKKSICCDNKLTVKVSNCRRSAWLNRAFL